MIIVAVIAMLLLDAVWIGINKPRYDALVASVQKKKMVVRIIPAIIAYLAMVIGLVFIIIPNAKRELAMGGRKGNTIITALKHGGLFGFVVYTIYNATNYAIFDGYLLPVAIMDTIWGTFLFFIVTWIGLVF